VDYVRPGSDLENIKKKAGRRAWPSYNFRQVPPRQRDCGVAPASREPMRPITRRDVRAPHLPRQVPRVLRDVSRHQGDKPPPGLGARGTSSQSQSPPLGPGRWREMEPCHHVARKFFSQAQAASSLNSSSFLPCLPARLLEREGPPPLRRPRRLSSSSFGDHHDDGPSFSSRFSHRFPSTTKSITFSNMHRLPTSRSLSRMTGANTLLSLACMCIRV
jgi:hypothetical protein